MGIARAQCKENRVTRINSSGRNSSFCAPLHDFALAWVHAYGKEVRPRHALL